MNPGIPLFRDSTIVRVSKWVRNWCLDVNWHRGAIYISMTTNTPTTVLSCGVIVTRFLRKQWHVTSHVFEVAYELAVLSFSHVQIEII